MIGEIVAQFVGEILCYGTGRVIVQVFVPHIRIPKTSATPWPQMTKRRWFAATYERDGVRYFYEDTVTLVGVLFWVFVAVAIVVGLHAYRS